MFRTNNEASAIEMFPGVVRRTLNSGEQIGYVASGRVRFVIGGDIQELSVGDSYLVPGGASHDVTALEPSVCIDTFSPVRKEYI